MAGAHGACPGTPAGAVPAALAFNYADDLDRALRALWRGVVGGPAAPAQGRSA